MIRHQKEIIICSAIWYKKLELKVPHALEPKGFRPFNCNEGIIFSGLRHGNCMYQMIAITGLKHHETGESIQGFLTNKNRFLDRYEGAKLVLENKQIEKLNYSHNKLFSEDLY